MIVASPGGPLDVEHAFAIWRRSPLIGAVLERWPEIELPDAWLVAGALAQTIWNDAFNLAPHHGIADIDIVYFDSGDLSEGAEAAHAQRIAALFTDLPVRFDVKNEARVHMWYEAKFGKALTPYISTEDAITTFPTTATSIGIQFADNHLRLSAPYGLTDLLTLAVRANKKQITRDVYEAKVDRWLTHWPNLRVICWDG